MDEGLEKHSERRPVGRFREEVRAAGVASRKNVTGCLTSDVTGEGFLRGEGGARLPLKGLLKMVLKGEVNNISPIRVDRLF